MSTEKESLRLFFALWPDAATRGKLAALQHDVGCREVRAQNLHLTLAFLGNQLRAAVPVLREVMESLTLSSMQLEIDTYGYFQQQRIVWAGPSVPPQALLDLHRALRLAIDEAQIAFKPLAGFKPHISLARDAKEQTGKLLQPVQWRVEKIALLESVSDTTGVIYHPLAERRF